MATLFIGIALGALLMWRRLLQLRNEQQQLLVAETERRAAAEASIENERRATNEKLALLENTRQQLTEAFKALASDALSANSRSFIELAQTSLGQYQNAAKGDLEKRQLAITELLKPLRESLSKVDLRINEIERSREHAYGALLTELRSMAEAQQLVRTEAANLVKALRAPQVRGRWGEMQLRRVVELAGMVSYCDFTEQESVDTDNGRLRPDLMIHLPGNKSIVVDAKTPLAAYLEAASSTDDNERAAQLADHARQLRQHILNLSRKTYWEQFQKTPEFVVMFLPGEMFFSAALEQDPTLIEIGAQKNVVLATPTTLIALLKAIAYGWRQEAVAENSIKIGQLGRELYKRITDLGNHFVRLGKSLNASVEAYNNAVGTLETRILVSARRFKDFEATSPNDLIEPPPMIEKTTRQLMAPELVINKSDPNAS
ncbi:MAG: DNA recombination protein RmuC [Deltaproteobacteria bacterium]|nr:DNA recombination protein RmuC [Deltaproteobacteria bacterium]